MPIYAYKCESCGFAKDVLQKISDPLLTKCPSCHLEAFQKQLTASGFQLKGSGWYVTDFRDGQKAAGSSESVPKPADATDAAAVPAASEVPASLPNTTHASLDKAASSAETPSESAGTASTPSTAASKS
jgi:putative FmdB family regulatory protein